MARERAYFRHASRPERERGLCRGNPGRRVVNITASLVGPIIITTAPHDFSGGESGRR